MYQYYSQIRAYSSKSNLNLFCSAKTAASEWKPSFLSDEEFLHLMLESVDGFVLIVNMCDNGRIMYASEGKEIYRSGTF